MNGHCCSNFKENLDCKERGFSIEKRDGIYFVVFRVVEDEFEDDLSSFFRDATKLVNTDKYGYTNLSLGGTMGISYCPWCGASLYDKKDKSSMFSWLKKN